MDYEESMKHLESLDKFGIHLGLERIKILLANMGNPQEKLKFIHIAGTNGKGSASTMLCNILTAAGYKTGLFTSPYVVDFRETFQIDGKMISKSEFAECAQFVLEKSLVSEFEGEHATKFEVMTAIAFEWFYRSKCDYVCLEVGLGGKDDSTNIIGQAVMQVIMSISMDHVGILGNSLKEIALKKAGIIKGNTTVIYPLQEKDVFEVIKSKCKEMNSSYIIPEVDELKLIEDDSNYETKADSFIYKNQRYSKSLLGEVQFYNCITVIEAANELKKIGLKISDDNIYYGLSHTTLPARMEILSDDPFVFLDGSHNADGAKALKTILGKIKQKKKGKFTIIMGVLADKDYKEILKMIAPFASEFIAVSPDNPRALEAEKLAYEANGYCSQCISFNDLNKAVSYAFDKTFKFECKDENNIIKNDNALVVCGSLYLAADIRQVLLEKLSDYAINH